VLGRIKTGIERGMEKRCIIRGVVRKKILEKTTTGKRG
jgi:hypothetical protein